jgi:hypothetical protein
MVEHHVTPEIVIHRDHNDDWRRIGLVDDYGQHIELSLAQLYRLAQTVLSQEFPLITGLPVPRADT